MKQNIYDDDIFFEKYSQKRRSLMGLAGANEWETLKEMLGDLRGKHVLDLGCGYGWHCQYAIEQGATKVVGVDISKKMLATAKGKTSSKIEYICKPIEDVDFSKESFDLVMSSLAFHYLAAFDDIAQHVAKWLKPQGSLVFTIEHPIYSAHGSQKWHKNEHGEIMHFPVDNYFKEGKRETNFLDEHVIKYHRTLTTYISDLLRNGFLITGVVEPLPTQQMIERDETMIHELRRPIFLIISARKK